jgi:hypothetical protein
MPFYLILKSKFYPLLQRLLVSSIIILIAMGRLYKIFIRFISFNRADLVDL